MDSLTQIVLGGAVGEVILGKKIGNKAILWGAIAGTIPDLDTIPGYFLDTVDRLDIHRGFSHSMVFAILSAPLFGWLASKIHAKQSASVWDWTQLFFWCIFTHSLLDIFTTWGTQLFWPLEWRLAIQSVFVIDPFYTVPFLIALIILMFLNKSSQRRRSINRFALIFSSLYLGWSVCAKFIANEVFEDHIQSQSLDYIQFESRPAPFSTFLWTANIETEDHFYITYYSLFDQDKNLLMKKVAKNHELLYPYRNNESLEKLIQLTKGYYTVEESKEGLVLNDLRFGLSKGFMDEAGQFVFRYEIKRGASGLEIEQMPNDMREMREMMPSLMDRIIGIKPS